MLEDLTLSKFSFLIRALEDIALPPGIVSFFKIHFQATFNRTICRRSEGKLCRLCHLKDECPYVVCFESELLRHSAGYVTRDTLPRPFILVIPQPFPRRYSKGDTFRIQLTLIGNARNYLDAFISTVDEMCRLGFSRRPRRFTIEKISNCGISPGEETSDHRAPFEASAILKNNREIRYEDIVRGSPPDSPHRVRLKFLTPTLIPNGMHYPTRPKCEHFFRELVNRINGLILYTGENGNGGTSKILFSELLWEKRNIRLSDEKIRWLKYRRYKKGDGKHNRQGFTGELEWMGDFDGLIPLLQLGELIHIGRESLYGSGYFQMLRD
jgi:hypothetical protein